MNLLDKNQIQIIEADVEQARITLSHLSEELIDHICCEVEEHMINGKTFEEAYEIIKNQTGIKVLQKIQENTRYLIDKNYAIMKNTMKISGNVSLALVALGTVLKIYHWPGAGISLVVGFALLCLLFFPAAVYVNNKEKESQSPVILNFSLLIGGISFMLGILFKVMHWPGSGMLLFAGWLIILLVFLPILLFVKLREAQTGKEKRIYILGAIALFIFEFAAMFKMFHWPGAGVLLLSGSVMLVVFFLPMFSYLKYRNATNTIGQYIFLITLSMYATILTALLAMNVSSDILSRFVNAQVNTAKIVEYFESKENLQAIIPADSSTNKNYKSIGEIVKLSMDLRTRIIDAKLILIQTVEEVDRETALTYLNNPALIGKKDNYDIVNIIMLGEEGNGLAQSLKSEIEIFRKKVQSSITSDPALSSDVGKMLNTSNVNYKEENKTWEELNFRNNMLISSLTLLSNLERKVKMVELKSVESLTQSKI